MFFVLFVRSFFFLFGRGNFSHCFLEFAEGFFLGCVQFFWNLNNKLDDMCSTDVFISKGRNTFSFQTDGCICLCSWF